MSDRAVAERMDVLNSGAPAQIADTSSTKSITVASDPGESLYNTVCQACHSAGIAGAPKTGDKTAWSSRLDLSNDVLYASVINGKNMMPARGGATGATDDDIREAVDYMLSKVR